MPDAPKSHGLTERGWIDHLLKRATVLGDERLIVPLGDDAAVVKPPAGQQLILTTDAMAEGTHFKREWLGWRGLAMRAILSAASDITAMGGEPYGCLVSLGCPPGINPEDLHRFADGLDALRAQHGLRLLGGDTVRSSHLFVDVTVIGWVGVGCEILQTGAKPGDAVWASGNLGKSRALLENIARGHISADAAFDLEAYLPPARWNFLRNYRSILKRQAPGKDENSAMTEAPCIRCLTDLSDGLQLDLQKILRGAPLGVDIHLDQLPVAPEVEALFPDQPQRQKEFALIGGEDYELLVIEEGDCCEYDEIQVGEIALTRVGVIVEGGSGIRVFWEGFETACSEQPFEHFPA